MFRKETKKLEKEENEIAKDTDVENFSGFMTTRKRTKRIMRKCILRRPMEPFTSNLNFL